MYARAVERLNFSHLLYFWAVAKEGSIAAACRRLHVAQPTISGQLRLLERALGHRLLERSGRGLALTGMGATVFRYADDIFSLGAELLDTVRGQAGPGPRALRVGVADVLPKLVVYRMLRPVLAAPEGIRLSCLEGKPPDLIARLVSHELDVVLTDTPVPPYSGIRAFSHRLGESGLAVFGTSRFATRHRRKFPESLHGAPLLLPTSSTTVRRTLDHWFEARGIRPVVKAEFDDSALLNVFGQSGIGMFVAPTIIEAEVRSQYDVRLVGRLPGLAEQFFAISMERTIRHPAVVHLTDVARARLSAEPQPARSDRPGRRQGSRRG